MARARVLDDRRSGADHAPARGARRVWWRWGAGLVAVAAAVVAGIGPSGHSPAFAADTAFPDTVIANVAVGEAPTGLAVSPNGARVYVANWFDDSLSVIDTSTNTEVTTISVGEEPVGVAVSPAGDRVYVTNSESGTVSVIDTADDRVMDTVMVGNHPTGVAVSADDRVFVANAGDDSVSVVDTSTASGTVLGAVPVGDYPAGVAVDPSSGLVYVTNNQDDSVSVIDPSTAPGTVSASIAVGGFPFGVTVDPDRGRAYVANSDDDSVSVIDTVSDTVIGTLQNVGAAPYGLALTPDGGHLYVANADDDEVAVIDISAPSPAVVTTVGVQEYPYAVAVAPDGRRVYVTNLDGDTVSVLARAFTVSFDLNGGSGTVPDAQTVTDGSLAKAPSDPARDGYTFSGWSASADGSAGLFDFDAPITDGPITLFAQWEAIAAPPTQSPSPSPTATQTSPAPPVDGGGEEAGVAGPSVATGGTLARTGGDDFWPWLGGGIAAALAGAGALIVAQGYRHRT